MTDKERFDLSLVRLEKEVCCLKMDKESSDLASKKFKKEVDELKRKENLAKKLAIDEFIVSEEYKEASSYFNKGFHSCKKQLRLRFPTLDIDDMQINHDLTDGDEDVEVDEGGPVAQDATLPIDQNLSNTGL